MTSPFAWAEFEAEAADPANDPSSAARSLLLS
jgi:hypothetical protein